MKNLYLQIKHKTFSKNDTGEMPNLELPANDKNLNEGAGAKTSYRIFG